MKYATRHYIIRNNFPLDRTQCTCSESLDGSKDGFKVTGSKEVRAVNRAGDDIYDHSYDITFGNNFVVFVLQMYLPAYYSILLIVISSFAKKWGRGGLYMVPLNSVFFKVIPKKTK